MYLTLRNAPCTKFFGHHVSIFQLPPRTSPNTHVHISPQLGDDVVPTREYLDNLPIYLDPEAQASTATPCPSIFTVSNGNWYSAPIVCLS